MTAPRDPDRLIHAFLAKASSELADPVYDAVRAEIEQKRQRAVIGPWRTPNMSKLVPIGLGAAAVVAVLFVGSQIRRFAQLECGRTGRRGKPDARVGRADELSWRIPPRRTVHRH